MDEYEIEAFGDEGRSGNGRFAVFSFIAFRSADVARAKSILSHVKASFGVPDNARFHCRELFSGEARERSEWRVLGPKQPAQVCRNLSVELLQLRPLWSYGHEDMSVFDELPKPTTRTIEFPEREGSPARNFSMPYGVDQAHRYAYLAAGWPLRQRYANKVRFWVDQNTTRMQWFNGRGKAHSFNPILPCSADVPTELQPLLEIADLFCYAAARCVSNDQRFGRAVFQAMHRRYGPVVGKMNNDLSAFGANYSHEEWLQKNGFTGAA